jgi:hypothetical protein
MNSLKEESSKEPSHGERRQDQLQVLKAQSSEKKKWKYTHGLFEANSLKLTN